MIQCSKCKEFFNSEILNQVIEHEHLEEDIILDKEYFGKIIKRK